MSESTKMQMQLTLHVHDAIKFNTTIENQLPPDDKQLSSALNISLSNFWDQVDEYIDVKSQSNLEQCAALLAEMAENSLTKMLSIYYMDSAVDSAELKRRLASLREAK
jgi:hypothetical protein